ncbi:unnamed protein product [Lactuca saligna]|uniref:Uncharacterized protein n=1 Tax=Lactuca saligna TaxID=75948 RepID=A0AA36EK86_LACSI|nr:unnamed protein product [Lactuca saligna]
MMHEEPNIVLPSCEAMSSSAPGGSLTPQPVHDVASERVARFLGCEGDVPAPRGKGILIDVRVSELEKENEHKSKQISDLQLNLGALCGCYFELTKKLIIEFGDKFKTSVGEPNVAEASHSAPTKETKNPQDDSQNVRMTCIIDRFEIEPAQSDPRAILMKAHKQTKRQGKRRLLFMKNSKQNIHGDRPQLSVNELGIKRFKNNYGDRYGILMWGFHDKLNI